MDNKLIFLKVVLGDSNIKRLGKTFCTEKKKYFYDTGTGKVLECSNEAYKILENIMENNTLNTLYELDLDAQKMELGLEEIKQAILEERILQAPPIKKFSGAHLDSLEQYVNEGLQQIILELTEQCNLRCSYCIYGENNDLFREFGQKSMDFEIAKKSIDYAAAHSGKELAISFYGGEPLLEFDLLKQCVDYCRETMPHKDLFFSITTNLTLMTHDKAEYFAKQKDFAVTCSIDGPEEIQNYYRKFPDGTGSFKIVLEGLKNIVLAMGEDAENRVNLSMVAAAPVTKEKFEKTQIFFESLEWLPQKILKNITYAQDKRMQEGKDDGYRKTHADIVDPMGTWSFEKIENASQIENREIFTANRVESSLLRIHGRRLYDKPMEYYTFNGCCVPASRRIYATADGKFKLCERIGLSPYIGNVDDGVSLELIKKYYVDDYMNNSIKYCKECWAVHLCSLCYAECYDENGINFQGKQGLCNSQRFSKERALIKYHSILERNPETLEYLNRIETK